MISSRKGKKSPLLIWNRNCYSARKAVNQIAAIRDPNVVISPSITSVYSFLSMNNFASNEFLDGFYNEHNFAKIRERMNVDSNYRKIKANHFIFPDEDNYDIHVRGELEVPIDFQIKVINKKTGRQIIMAE